MAATISESINKPAYQGHRDQRYGPSTFSQHGEDLVLCDMFDRLGIDKPSYLDIGAHHPTTISNTHLLHLRGSRGVNVEANPLLIRAFHQERKNDVNICAAVVPDFWETGFIDLHSFGDMSGRNTCDYDEALRFAHESGLAIQGKMSCFALKISDLISKYSWAPDLVSIDVEGFDFSILGCMKFQSRNAPKVMIVEVRKERAAAMGAMMAKQHNMTRYVRLGENVIYVQADCIEKLW